MSESGPWQPVIDAAEGAAAAGDYALAERHLRDAVALQEAALGPLHPDLANTLNNLGVVCEITSRPEDAERCYRRAYTIALSSLPGDHPFVATSLQNLTDFCKARQLPLNLPEPEPRATVVDAPRPLPAGLGELQFPPEPAAISAAPDNVTPEQLAPTPLAAPATSSAPPVPVFASTSTPVPIRSSPQGGRGSSIVWIAALGVLAVVVWAMWPRPAGEQPPATSGAPPTGSPPASAAAPPVITPPSTAATPDTPATPPPSSRIAGGRATGVTVVDARLCRDLVRQAEWVCRPPESPAALGPMYFYVRLKSSTDTVVHVRWYREGQLRQGGDLRIGANHTAGYRTYSRHTVDRAGGSWRVELKAQDGRVLAEERFTVRAPAAQRPSRPRT